MTISSPVVRNDYDNTLGASTFPYTFKIFDASDIVVILKDSAGLEQTMVLNTNYTVTGVGSEAGGNVVFASAVPAGTSVHIVAVLDRSSSGKGIPLTQTTDLVNETGFFQDRIEDRFDILCRQVQVLSDETARSAKLSVATNPDDVTLEFPSPRAGYVLGSADGETFTNLETVNVNDAIAGDWRVDRYFSGVHFTGGVTNSLTLATTPASLEATLVTFDGVTQAVPTYNITGTTLVFDAPIPSGVSTVEVRVPVTLALEVGTGDFLVTAAGSSTPRLLSNRFGEYVNIRDFGATGNNSDDAAALTAAITRASQLGPNVPVYFPSGTYDIGFFTAPAAPLYLIGDHCSNGEHSSIINGSILTTGRVAIGRLRFEGYGYVSNSGDNNIHVFDSYLTLTTAGGGATAVTKIERSDVIFISSSGGRADIVDCNLRTTGGNNIIASTGISIRGCRGTARPTNSPTYISDSSLTLGIANATITAVNSAISGSQLIAVGKTPHTFLNCSFTNTCDVGKGNTLIGCRFDASSFAVAAYNSQFIGCFFPSSTIPGGWDDNTIIGCRHTGNGTGLLGAGDVMNVSISCPPNITQPTAREGIRLDNDLHNPLCIWVGGYLSRVSVGTLDSGGTGFRVLRTPNNLGV